MRTMIGLLVGLLGWATVQATPVVAGSAQPLEALGTWTSQPGEARDAFVLRVAAAVYPYTRAHGVEVCGVLLQSEDGTGFRLPMFTDHSQVACRSTAVPQAGFVATKLTVHTHPSQTSFQPNAQDMALLPAYAANPKMRWPVDGDRPSDRDFANGAGYVVASGSGVFGKPHLLYQTGVGSVTDLGTLPKGSAVPDASADLAGLNALAAQVLDGAEINAVAP